MGPPRKVAPGLANPVDHEDTTQIPKSPPSKSKPRQTPKARKESPTHPRTEIDDSMASAATGTPRSPTNQKVRPSTGGEEEKSEKKKARSEELGIDDLLLPRTLTSRLSRGTLPPNTSIQRDALLALTKSATVFISYLSHNANILTSRKTIQSQDILEALRETELWGVNVTGGSGLTLGERVRAEVEKWEGEVRGKRKGYRERVKARESGGGAEGEGDADGDVDGRGPLAKRARMSDAGLDVTMDGDGDRHGEGDEDEDIERASAQLRGEAAVNGDATETEPEDEQDQDPEEEEEEEQEQEDEDENEQEEIDESEMADQRGGMAHDDSRRGTHLAPNGRVEVGSDDDESD